MKKVLSFVLVLIVVFSLGTNVIFADEYVENLVAMYESMGMSADALAAEFANYGIILDVDTMQIKEASTGKVFSEEEFNTFMETVMGGGSSTSAPVSSGAPVSEADYSSEKYVYLVEKLGYEQREGDTEKKLYFKITVYMMGTDALLDYAVETAALKKVTYEEDTFMEERALKINSVEVDENGLADQALMGYIFEDGFLTTTERYIAPMGDMSELLKSDSAYKKDQVVAVYAFKFGDNVKKFDVAIGKSNSIIASHTSIKWTIVLIIGLGVVVVALGVLIVLLAINGKKKVEKQNSLKDLNYVSEDKVFEALVEEAGVDMEDKEIIEEIAEESEEVIEEVVEENNDTDEVEDSEEK